MSDLAKPLSEYPGDATFERGLSWLLDGIHAITSDVHDPDSTK
jgi:hypothetical protein